MFGSFGYKDIGDEAMLTQDLDYLVNELGISKHNILLVGGRAGYISSYHRHPRNRCLSDFVFREYPFLSRLKLGGVTALLRSTLCETPIMPSLRFIKNCHAALITGGGTINTRDPRGASLKRMHSFVMFCRRHAVPVFMSGQTVGPLGINDDHDRLAGDIVRHVDVLTVRDNIYSRKYLDVLKVKPKEFVETCDDAFCLPYEDEVLPPALSSFLSSGRTIAFNVTDYTADTDDKRRFMAQLCEYLLATYKTSILMVPHTPRDFDHLHLITNMIDSRYEDRVRVPDTRNWRDKTIKRLISLCRCAIGGRYHFLVFAATARVPIVGMCGNYYSYVKQDGFARLQGLAHFILTEADTWNMNAVQGRIQDAMDYDMDSNVPYDQPSLSMERFKEWICGIVGAH